MIELARVKDILEMPMTAEVLRRYKYVFGTLYNTDASDDYTFQTAFCEFFKPIQSFSEEFRMENKYEMAAASIMINCVNPRHPAWNKLIVNAYFDMDEPGAEEASPEKCSKLYDDFEDKLYAYMNSPEGSSLLKAFDAKFPNAEISDVSKVAIILWQGEI